MDDDVTASLPPELVSEILLRLRPDEPEHLFHAAFVCNAWLRAICDPAFLLRYCAFQVCPPLLGLLHRLRVIEGDPAPRLACTTAVPLSPTPPFASPSTAAMAASSSTRGTTIGISLSGTLSRASSIACRTLASRG
ncbi:hypothetical protein E2562_036321 [Oryza meyeriana var. granulata]|uniref:F-box domain-containing protein n=1 Tax=Oryza meyeriana var. granulata TaxID=110450 RepID=A0A6G1D9M3_9ORYZ|nr:hypothetical protein E2562_036321 [Oryza meyeriana var. granulata]